MPIAAVIYSAVKSVQGSVDSAMIIGVFIQGIYGSVAFIIHMVIIYRKSNIFSEIDPKTVAYEKHNSGRLYESDPTRETALTQDIYSAAFVSTLQRDVQLQLFPDKNNNQANGKPSFDSRRVLSGERRMRVVFMTFTCAAFTLYLCALLLIKYLNF